jgi:hypothetical protein
MPGDWSLKSVIELAIARHRLLKRHFRDNEHAHKAVDKILRTSYSNQFASKLYEESLLRENARSCDQLFVSSLLTSKRRFLFQNSSKVFEITKILSWVPMLPEGKIGSAAEDLKQFAPPTDKGRERSREGVRCCHESNRTRNQEWLCWRWPNSVPKTCLPNCRVSHPESASFCTDC